MKKKNYEYSRSTLRVIFASMFVLTFAVFGIYAQEERLDITSGDGSVTLTWDEGSAVDSVVVTGIRSITNADLAPLSSPLTVENLDNGKLYAFEVYFHSTEWPVVNVGVLYGIPGEVTSPRNIIATTSGNTVTLKWQPPVDGKDYTYKLITETGEKKTIGSNATSHTVSNLVNGKEYKFSIVAIQTFTDFPGKDRESWATATIAGASSPVAATPEAALSPVTVKALAGNIEVTTPEDAELKVFTIGGQPYLSRHIAQGNTTVAVAKGMYFVTLGNTTTKVSVH